jgi:hypothetical protein
MIGLAALSLAACGGGGGGGPAKSASAVFTSFAAVSPSQSYELSGTTRQMTYTRTGDTLTGVGAPTAGNGSLSFGLDSGGAINTAGLASSPVNLSYATANGDTIVDGGTVITATSGNSDNTTLFIDAAEVGYNYQTFGLWGTGDNASAGYLGAGSFGAQTASGSVPAAGIASYSGVTTGYYADTNSTLHITAASFSSSVNFGTNTFTASTSGTQRASAGAVPATVADANLNISASGTLSGASFSGTAAATGMSGTMSGRFYGPVANEMGGTFGMTGVNGTYIGSFGAAR